MIYSYFDILNKLTMDSELSKFDFLIGDWNMESHIPKSRFSEAGTDTGAGTFRRILSDKYVVFEYSGESGGAAEGIFGWDEKLQAFRYWWFENSGSFANATCNFINDSTLAMNWHDSLLVQTFTRESPEKVILIMSHPDEKGGYEPVLEVILTKK